jgi:protein-tyrosine-phosphatase
MTIPSIFLLLFISVIMTSFNPNHKKMHKKLMQYCEPLPDQFDNISTDRKSSLEELGEYILKEQKNGEKVNLTFICTHNSRRSHFGQLWALTAARYYGLEDIETFSGGTEATAFHPNAVAVLERAGFKITSNGAEENPKYLASVGNGYPESLMFSKKYDDRQNPAENFCAIMVCSQADEACPFVPGAEERLSLPYDDPKAFDDTPAELQKYDERCREMARDLFYMMEYVKINEDV